MKFKLPVSDPTFKDKLEFYSKFVGMIGVATTIYFGIRALNPPATSSTQSAIPTPGPNEVRPERQAAPVVKTAPSSKSENEAPRRISGLHVDTVTDLRQKIQTLAVQSPDSQEYQSSVLKLRKYSTAKQELWRIHQRIPSSYPIMRDFYIVCKLKFAQDCERGNRDSYNERDLWNSVHQVRILLAKTGDPQNLIADIDTEISRLKGYGIGT